MIDVNTLAEKLVPELIPNNLDGKELDRRLQLVVTALGLMEQMKKLPSAEVMMRTHKIHTARTMLKDLMGARGETF